MVGLGAVEVSSASPARGDDVEVIVRTPAVRSGSVLLYVDEAPTPEEQVVDGIELTMITVGKRPTTPALSLSSPTITLGQDVTVTATVTAGATGTVEYFDGTTSLGTVPVVKDKAALAFTPKAPGARTITATYSGDASHEGRTSDGVTLVVETPVVAPPVTPPVVDPPVETPPVVAPPVVVPPVVAPPVVTPPAKAKVSLSTPAFSKSTQIYGHKKVIKTVKLTTKHKGKITLTLPKRYRTTIKVKTAYQSTSTITGSTSKVTTVKAR